MKIEKEQWQADAFRKATPVARKWAIMQMANGNLYENIEEEFLDILFVEERLYEKMKKSLVEHVRRHGLSREALVYFEEFENVRCFNKNAYNKILKKIRRAYVRQNEEDRNFEYLIAKINEYLQKVTDLGNVAYQMLQDGKQPDLEAWGDKVVLNDNLFEENKQFLKQALHHLAVLEKNRCKLGVAEIKMLLYHKQGCRREKLYWQVEEWMIKIYRSLQTEEEQQEAYKDICSFIAETVPQVGYISPKMIWFVFDEDYLSETSRDLLLAIKPVVSRLGMSSLIIFPLKKLYGEFSSRRSSVRQIKSDQYVVELLKAYSPKEIEGSSL
ncbi:MAG: hypothetical protein IJ852_03350 [Alphaproteobacteria bacterium]|nr:hypothetical protein [Alphaproteobacteria bacterium]